MSSLHFVDGRLGYSTLKTVLSKSDLLKVNKKYEIHNRSVFCFIEHPTTFTLQEKGLDSALTEFARLSEQNSNLIYLGIEPRTFSVLTKCDNRYTNKPLPTRVSDLLMWENVNYHTSEASLNATRFFSHSYQYFDMTRRTLARPINNQFDFFSDRERLNAHNGLQYKQMRAQKESSQKISDLSRDQTEDLFGVNEMW